MLPFGQQTIPENMLMCLYVMLHRRLLDPSVQYIEDTISSNNNENSELIPLLHALLTLTILVFEPNCYPESEFNSMSAYTELESGDDGGGGGGGDFGILVALSPPLSLSLPQCL
nr:hypothetical transcript [Hymenolepis microstoma]